MIRIENQFDKLILFDGVELSSPELKGGILKIVAKNIPVLPGHSLNQSNKEITIERGTLVFDDVTKSIRVIHEHTESSEKNNFLNSYEIVDINIVGEKDSSKFQIEGFQKSPSAYVEWEIESKSFSFEVP